MDQKQKVVVMGKLHFKGWHKGRRPRMAFYSFIRLRGKREGFGGGGLRGIRRQEEKGRGLKRMAELELHISST